MSDKREGYLDSGDLDLSHPEFETAGGLKATFMGGGRSDVLGWSVTNKGDVTTDRQGKFYGGDGKDNILDVVPRVQFRKECDANSRGANLFSPDAENKTKPRQDTSSLGGAASAEEWVTDEMVNAMVSTMDQRSPQLDSACLLSWNDCKDALIAAVAAAPKPPASQPNLTGAVISDETIERMVQTFHDEARDVAVKSGISPSLFPRWANLPDGGREVAINAMRAAVAVLTKEVAAPNSTYNPSRDTWVNTSVPQSDGPSEKDAETFAAKYIHLWPVKTWLDLTGSQKQGRIVETLDALKSVWPKPTKLTREMVEKVAIAYRKLQVGNTDGAITPWRNLPTEWRDKYIRQLSAALREGGVEVTEKPNEKG